MIRCYSVHLRKNILGKRNFYPRVLSSNVFLRKDSQVLNIYRHIIKQKKWKLKFFLKLFIFFFLSKNLISFGYIFSSSDLFRAATFFEISKEHPSETLDNKSYFEPWKNSVRQKKKKNESQTFVTRTYFKQRLGQLSVRQLSWLSLVNKFFSVYC